MKKFFILILLIPLSTYANKYQLHKWSFSVFGGLNMFDGDVRQSNVDILPTSITDITYGGNIEYSVNEKCGLSLDYHYIPLKADGDHNLKIRTTVKDINFNGVVNLSQLLCPEIKSNFSLISTIGFGVSRYEFNTSVTPSGGTIKGKNDDNYNIALAGTFPVSFAIEYNMSKNFNIGFKINYIAFNKDNLEGLYYNIGGTTTVYKGVTNDYVGLGTIYLKFKVPNNNTKNIDSTFILPIKKDTVKKEYNTYINIINNINSNNINSNVNSTVDSYNSSVNNEYDGCVTCRDSAIYSKENDIDDGFIDSIPSVYFDFDKYTLDQDALKIVKKVANFMLTYPDYYLEIRGYCDHMGDIDYNQILSNNRVFAVKRYLIEYYNIPKNHIIANGHGKIDIPPMKYRPNRRCDFFFFKIK